MDLKSFNRIEDFVIKLKTSGVSIEENNIERQKSLLEFSDIDGTIEMIEEHQGIEIPKSNLHYFYLTSLHLDWSSSGQKEDFLYGGYRLNFFNNLPFPSHFWKIDNEFPEPDEEEFFNKLAYFQRSGHGDDGTYSCFLREGKYPCDIYFYDRGIYWKIDLDLDEYFELLLKYKSVAAWQFFYIDTEELIKKLDGLNCKAWPFITFSDLPEETTPRVEGVLYHMDKIIRLFPKLFPEVDLSYATKKRDALKVALGK